MDARIIVKFECMEPLPRLIFSGETPIFASFLISVHFGVLRRTDLKRKMRE